MTESSSIPSPPVADSFDLLRTHSQFQQLPLNPILPLSTFLITPINVVMVTQQIGTSHARPSFWRTYRRLKQDEDWPAFVKGFYTTFLATVLEDRIRRAVTSQLSRLSSARLSSLLLPVLPVLVGHWVTYPLKLIRTRLIQQIKHQKYAGEWDCFVKMRQEEGPLSMWRGLSLDTLRVALQLFLNHWAHAFITTPIFKRIPPYLALFAGVPAELAIACFSFPLATIVTKLQAQAANIPKHMQPDVQADGVLECVQRVAQRPAGIFSLWNGYFAFCIKTVAQMAAITCLTHAFWKVGFLKARLGK